VGEARADWVDGLQAGASPSIAISDKRLADTFRRRISREDLPPGEAYLVAFASDGMLAWERHIAES